MCRYIAHCSAVTGQGHCGPEVTGPQITEWDGAEWVPYAGKGGVGGGGGVVGVDVGVVGVVAVVGVVGVESCGEGG